MTKRAMPMLVKDGKFLELRNSADQPVLPATELKTGEEARAAAKRAVEEFFGMDAPEDAIKEGFQARVGQEVVAVYPVDASRMELALLRPAESVASWAWRDVPPSMGHVVALGFPRNLGTRYNAAEAPAAEAEAQYGILADAVAAKTAALRGAAGHERHARAEELAQAVDDLRLLASDMGLKPPAVRLNAADAPLVTARALIKQNDGTLIAARQKDGRSLLPGGHIENGETPEAAVARELQEELGLDIQAALTGETYDFAGEDGGAHRVFVVDGGKLDLSKLTPGDDVADAEFVNSPFTDSHGKVHPQEKRDNGAGEPCPSCGGNETFAFKGAHGDNMACSICDRTWDASRKNGAGDLAEIERHAEGIAHEVGELEKKNGFTTNEQMVMREGVTCPKCGDSGRLHVSAKTGLCDACMQEAYDRENGSAECNECKRPMTADGKGGWTGHAEGCSTGEKKNSAGSRTKDGKTLDEVSRAITGKAYKDLPDDGPQQDHVMHEFERLGGVAQQAFQNAAERQNHIEKLEDGKFRLLSHEGKNLGTFDSHEAAANHEGEVEWFKEHKNSGDALDEKTKAMIKNWLQMHNGDREGLAAWMRDSLRLGSIQDCRSIIEEVVGRQNSAGAELAKKLGVKHPKDLPFDQPNGHGCNECDDVKAPLNVEGYCKACAGTQGEYRNAAGEKEWYCLDCGKNVSAQDREPGGAHEKHRTQLVERKNAFVEYKSPLSQHKGPWKCGDCAQVLATDEAAKEHKMDTGHSSYSSAKANDAGDHGHQYMNKTEGPFPVVRCNSVETVATQETPDAWRCEGCGDLIPGPPTPEPHYV